MTRPANVLLIHSDQHRWDCLGVNGHPFLRTPHLDRLAAEGMNFTHAFTPIPICSPARNCLLHGQWSVQHGCIMNSDSEAARWPADDLPSFSRQLADAGYYTAYVGKWHVSDTRAPEDYGFAHFPGHRAYDAWLNEQGCPPAEYANGWFGETIEGRTPEQTHLAWCADRTIEYLADAKDSGNPFFIRWDPPEPHLPNIVPEPFASLYPPESIPPWGNFDDPLDNKPIVQRQARKTWKLDDWTWDQWAPIVGRYLGEITLMDREIGRVLDALATLGLADDTLVIYTTDHGDMCGSHGMIDKHFVMYDDIVRVPMIARWPGRIAPGTVCDSFVAHEIDLASTFCQVGQIATPDTFRGQSLVPLFAGQTNDRPDILSMYHGNQFGLYTQRMVRDRRWKYVWNPTAEDELYDLDSDPNELTNRTSDPTCADELARLRARLLDWMREIADPLVNPWIITQLTEGLSL